MVFPTSALILAESLGQVNAVDGFQVFLHHIHPGAGDLIQLLQFHHHIQEALQRRSCDHSGHYSCHQGSMVMVYFFFVYYILQYTSYMKM